jgi:hypothetical protein
MAKDELKDALRRLLRDVLEARFKGGNYGKLARAHGYADGYMRAMLDAGIVERGELLKLVCTERQRFVEEAPRTVVAAH